MNTIHCLIRIQFASVSGKRYFTLDDETLVVCIGITSSSICIVTINIQTIFPANQNALHRKSGSCLRSTKPQIDQNCQSFRFCFLLVYICQEVLCVRRKVFNNGQTQYQVDSLGKMQFLVAKVPQNDPQLGRINQRFPMSDNFSDLYARLAVLWYTIV